MLSWNKSYKNRKVSLTIHCKYKYFDSTVQRAEDRRQKFYFCRLPFDVNVKLNLSIVSTRPLMFFASGNIETTHRNIFGLKFAEKIRIFSLGEKNKTKQNKSINILRKKEY